MTYEFDSLKRKMENQSGKALVILDKGMCIDRSDLNELYNLFVIINFKTATYSVNPSKLFMFHELSLLLNVYLDLKIE